MKPTTYKYITIYQNVYDCMNCVPRLYFNKGEAGRGAVEYQLAYTGELSDLQKEYRDIFRTVSSNTYYLTRHEAAIANEEGERIWDAQLCPPYLKPVELPVTAYLAPGDRGLYTNLNLHPEIDGRTAKGKVYFPDRSCADDLVYGEAIITEVRDKGSYGFFKGHNVKYEWPTDDQLDAYIHDRNDMWNEVLVYIETAHFGKFILTGSRFTYGSEGYVVHNGIGVRDGELVPISDYMRIEQDKVREVKKVEIPDFICQRYHDCSFDKFMKKFVQLPQADKLHRWGRSSDKYISHLMDEAVDSAVVYPTVTEQSGVFFYYLRPDGIASALSCFSREEMDEIIKTVNQVNMAAITQIQSLVKRGKMNITI